MLMAAWAGIALTFAADTARRAGMVHEALHVRVALSAAMALAFALPDSWQLCESSPTLPFRWVQGMPEGGKTELRWRYLGAGVVLAEIEVVGPRGGRANALLWMTGEVVEPSEAGPRCVESRLRTLGPGSVFPRPGE